MADAYARAGIAALTYDKRGTGRSTGDWNTADFDALADDAAAGLALLLSRPDIDKRHIGLSGGSQAGWINALAALRVPEVKFIVLQSSSAAASPQAQELDRIRLSIRADRYSEAEVATAVRLKMLGDEYARTGFGWDSLQILLDRTRSRPWRVYFGDEFSRKDHPDWQWWRKAMTYDFNAVWSRINASVLGVYGGADKIQPTDKAIAALKLALASGGNCKYAFRVFPNATHNFQITRTGSALEEPLMTRINPEMYNVVLAWVRRETGLSKSEPPVTDSSSCHSDAIKSERK